MLGKNFRIAVMCLALVALWRAPELLAESAGDSFSVTLFEHVRIFNGKTGTLSAPTNVLVQANKIKEFLLSLFRLTAATTRISSTAPAGAL